MNITKKLIPLLILTSSLSYAQELKINSIGINLGYNNLRVKQNTTSNVNKPNGSFTQGKRY
jgi:hypothetical protein